MSDFIGDGKCVTHHCACDCREALIAELLTAAHRVDDYMNDDGKFAGYVPTSLEYAKFRRAIRACDKAGIGRKP